MLSLGQRKAQCASMRCKKSRCTVFSFDYWSSRQSYWNISERKQLLPPGHYLLVVPPYVLNSELTVCQRGGGDNLEADLWLHHRAS